MSGETEEHPSGWTIDSLHSHLKAIIEANDRRYAERFSAQEVAMSAALAAAEKAVLKAETAAERRFESVNEFRAQLSDQASTFMPRLEAEQRIGQNADKVATFEGRLSESLGRVHSRLDVMDGRSGGLSAGWGYLIGAVGLIGAIVALLTR